MRRVVYTCDRCGREIRTSEENPMMLMIDFAQRESNDTEKGMPAPEDIRVLMSTMVGRDYCYGCIKEIVSCMNGASVNAGGCIDSADDERQQAMMEENQRLQQEVDQLNQRIADMKLEEMAESVKRAPLPLPVKRKGGRPVTRPATGKPVKKEPLKKEPKEPDKGKILALDDAGWGADTIALEMHMDEAEVVNILKRERQKYQ